MAPLYLFDRNENYTPTDEQFSGAAGLFTRRGVVKSGFNAYVLLAKMKGDIIYQQEGCCVMRTSQTLQIYLYNYAHYDEQYRQGRAIGLSSTDRYQIFKFKALNRVSLTIKGLNPGSYPIQTWAVNKKEGSAYDEWVKIGAPMTDTPAIIKYLNSKGAPAETYGAVNVADGLAVLEFVLEPHDILLAEVQL